jgi:ATP-dependent Lon protease
MSDRPPDRHEDAARAFPIVPVPQRVVFPRLRAELSVARPHLMRAVLEAERDGSRVFVVACQKHADMLDPGPEDVRSVATLVQIVSLRSSDRDVQMTVEGLYRVRIDEWLDSDPYDRVMVSHLFEPAATSAEDRTLVRLAHELFDRYIKLPSHHLDQHQIDTIRGVRLASRLADTLASSVIDDPEQQQKLLEEIEPKARLEHVCVHLGNAIEIFEVEQRIRQRLRDQVERRQRHGYLREHLLAVQHELGQDADSEMQGLRDRACTLGMPPEVETRLLKEIARLERLPPNSAESGVLRHYIDWLLAIPWQERTEDRLDIAEATRVLDADHDGLEHVKKRIIEFLAVRKLRASKASGGEASRGPILCLIGPPGVGKTSLGESIARSLGRKFKHISLGGVHDEAEIRGHRRTYVGALPGRIIYALKNVGVRNPVLLLDEIDKLASDYRGDPAAALLEVLDPAQNRTFTDNFLEVPYDLSEVFFICTGNNDHTIPRALADRLEIIEIHGYTEDEKVAIAHNHLWGKVLRDHGLEPGQVQISENVLRSIVRHYTREAGVRGLERQLATICRSLAYHQVMHPDGRAIRVTPKMVEQHLGAPHHSASLAMGADQVGLALGLAWTEQGGALLPVEVVVLRGHGSLSLTGQQGDVMQESARTAISYIRTRAGDLGISPDFTDQFDLHIHLPESAVPKDGPSAGITIAMAMISALTRRPVRGDTAMTGEISLLGWILPVGGLRDKVLAAHQAGIRRIVLPADNQNDLDEIPEHVLAEMKIVFAARMEDVERETLCASGPAARSPSSAEQVQKSAAPPDAPDAR